MFLPTSILLFIIAIIYLSMPRISPRPLQFILIHILLFRFVHKLTLLLLLSFLALLALLLLAHNTFLLLLLFLLHLLISRLTLLRFLWRFIGIIVNQLIILFELEAIKNIVAAHYPLLVIQHTQIIIFNCVILSLCVILWTIRSIRDLRLSLGFLLTRIAIFIDFLLILRIRWMDWLLIGI